MVGFGMLESVLFLSLAVTGVRAQVPHKVVPLNEIPSEQWIEVVSGDPSKAGSAFVVRIHNDAGYACPPHTHPTDENIVVVQGSWSVGMGTRINLSTVQLLELGAVRLGAREDGALLPVQDGDDYSSAWRRSVLG